MNLRSFTRRLDHLAERIDNHVRRSVFAYRARRVYESRSHPIRLHVGCGSVHPEGWINTDFYESRTTDFAWDASLPYPLPDSFCRFIYNEHFLEHVPLQRFLADCDRLLVSGGVLRIAMPSLESRGPEIHRARLVRSSDQESLTRPKNREISTSKPAAKR
jgi:predicted SAM-dependent methyltransferase